MDEKELEKLDKLDINSTFKESGNSDDEVTLNFDEDKKLFVSRNFLRYASPVFEAMFNNDFLERKENSVNLTGKIYEDFTEFLLCIHPRILKRVTDSNVLRLAPIAEEYQVTSMVKICKEIMSDLLKSSVERAKITSDYKYHAEPLRNCIRVLATAVRLNYDDVVNIAVKTVAKFEHVFYNRNQYRPRSFCEFSPDVKIGNETLKQIGIDCMKLFEQLPVKIRCKIYSERLLHWKDTTLIA